ncbi:MAG: hypothetical protein RLZZ303_1889, partial [Candidatus Hydrogenedentota bacterium]
WKAHQQMGLVGRIINSSSGIGDVIHMIALK